MRGLVESLGRKQRETAEVQRALIDTQGEAIVACAQALSEAFEAGGRLWTMGNGGSACDAAHLAVEMTHPIVEKRPALPAFCLAANPAALSAIANDRDYAFAFARQLEVLGVAGDVALAFSTSGKSRSVVRALRRARELGMLTIAMTGGDGGALPELCDHCFVVPSFSTHRIQESHVLLLHLLWDVLHVARGEEDVLG